MVEVFPATADRRDDLAALFGATGVLAGCGCMFFLLTTKEFEAGWHTGANRERLLGMVSGPASSGLRSEATREDGASEGPETRASEASASATAGVADPPMGLLAYRDGAPIGWCAAGPRSRYGKAMRSPLYKARDGTEDDSVWLVPCLFVRREARRTGVTRPLLVAAVRLAETHGAAAVEAFPLSGGERRPAGEAYLGTEAMYAALGFRPVRRPSARRVIMRLDLPAGPLDAD